MSNFPGLGRFKLFSLHIDKRLQFLQSIRIVKHPDRRSSRWLLSLFNDSGVKKQTVHSLKKGT